LKIFSRAKAIPPMAGRRLRVDCKKGMVFKEGANHHKIRQAKPMRRIQ